MNLKSVALGLFTAGAMLWPAWVSAANWSIHYPRPIDENDQRHEYPLTLLKLALSKTGVRYTLTPSERILLQGKSIRQLKENREINILWVMTDAQREKELLPIRIPIHKGLIGWRVFLINQSMIDRFDQVTDFQSLTKFTPLQGAEWPDTKILQSNGFNVQTVSDFPEAFSRLAMHQGDFFPRAISEVLGELSYSSLDPDIVLEKNLIIHYPTAMYFFVNRSNPTMARLIETGLRRALEDGSFDNIFVSHHREALLKMDIGNRKIFHLENPLLPPGTPLDDEALWFDPEKHTPEANQ
ncbi:amino acid ABC transporter substrate-binding protein [Aestuariibacter sp. GS-14]|uniref:amino acid ABC transporter substrate-binding protein n=1 Tax=Aestuariibacter sp. GS-14 TaxID=2590670 RepID=UPI00112A0F3C|nr:amino acid ABC transporter substrate-binding protein [Aestuariibacter sp. GS-14]TPV61785.1 amino acid ABC transporter substrate-binding protein [Aestuariibacter sp. GS-14]